MISFKINKMENYLRSCQSNWFTKMENTFF